MKHFLGNTSTSECLSDTAIILVSVPLKVCFMSYKYLHVPEPCEDYIQALFFSLSFIYPISTALDHFEVMCSNNHIFLRVTGSCRSSPQNISHFWNYLQSILPTYKHRMFSSCKMTSLKQQILQNALHFQINQAKINTHLQYQLNWYYI